MKEIYIISKITLLCILTLIILPSFSLYVFAAEYVGNGIEPVNGVSVNLEDALNGILQKMSYTSEKPLFTSGSEGYEYVVHSYIWKDMETIYPCSDIQIFEK